MSALPFELINSILELSSDMKNSKYVMYVDAKGHVRYRFNYNYSGYKMLSGIYNTRRQFHQPMDVLIHDRDASMAYSMSNIHVLSACNGTATVAIEMEYTINQRWLVFDVKLPSGYVETDAIAMFRNTIYPSHGTFYYKFICANNKWGTGSQQIAVIRLRQYNGRMWLEVKCLRPDAHEGFWGINDWGELDYIMEGVDDNTDDLSTILDDDDFGWVDTMVNEDEDAEEDAPNVPEEFNMDTPMLQMYM